MEKEILKKVIIYILLIFLFISCKNENQYNEDYAIYKAIELVKNNKSINDTLLKFRQKLGVEFIPCSIISTEKFRILGFQIVQSNMENAPPIKIDRPYKIETIQGVDVFFSTTTGDTNNHHLIIEDKAKKLIKKGYLTINGPIPIIDSRFVNFVFCKNDDNVFEILSSEFLYDEEMKARIKDQPFVVEKFYPKCN